MNDEMIVSGNFNITRATISVPEILSPLEEVDRLLSWLSYSTSMREVSLYMLYRIWRDNMYMDIQSNDPNAVPGQPLYETWAKFLAFVMESVDVSRSTVYSRLKVYGLLEWLEYSDEQMLSKVSLRPNLHERILSAIFIWDQDARVPSGVKTTKFGELNSETFKPDVREFIDSLEAFDSINDALEYLKFDVMGQPMVRVSLMGDNVISVTYDSPVYDIDTGEQTGENATVEFHCDDILPSWVTQVLHEKYKFS